MYDKDAQRFRNKLSNSQGQHFEREILAGCKLYEQHGIACIDKTPEPFRVTSKGKSGIFTGRFTAHAQPDFQGTMVGGKSIVFEAKRTEKDRIQKEVLTETQMELLEKHHNLNALAAVCICIKNECFFVPWHVWRDMKSLYGRKYLKSEDIPEYKVKYDGAVHFLEKYEADGEICTEGDE